MLSYIIWRIRAWLKYDDFHLTPGTKGRMAMGGLWAITFSWMGVSLFVFGAFLCVREEVRELFALRVHGKVVRVSEEIKQHVPMYQPVFRYSLPNGEIYQASTGSWSSSFSYHEGDEVTVLYWKDRPEGGTIEGINFEPGGALAIMGLIFAVVWRVSAKLVTNETWARIQWCLLLKLPWPRRLRNYLQGTQ